jgi:NADH-quinone oxidoreductase subunit L
MPVTHWTFLIGSLALAGIPPLAGFWSKDEILAVVGLAASESKYQNLFGWLRLGVLVTSGLTAFYIFRAYFLTFWGPTRVPKAAGAHPHESPPVMTWPLMILAIAAAGIGFVLGPSHRFFHWLSHAPALGGVEPHPLSFSVAATGTAVGVAGMLIAWWLYVGVPGLAATLSKSSLGLYQLSLGKFFFDEIYDLLVVRPLRGLAVLSSLFDKGVIDSLVDWIAGRPALVGRWFRKWQSGLIQSYAALMFVGVTLLAVYIVWT